MITGQIVHIYQKPITGEEFEGTAALLRELNPDEGDGLSRWEVQFTQDDFVAQRTVNKFNATGDNYPTAPIYDNPFNKTGFQGVAHLLMRDAEVEGQSSWLVRFGTHDKSYCIVNEEDIIWPTI